MNCKYHKPVVIQTTERMCKIMGYGECGNPEGDCTYKTTASGDTDNIYTKQTEIIEEVYRKIENLVQDIHCFGVMCTECPFNSEFESICDTIQANN